MSETGQCIGQKQGNLIRDGLQTLRDLHGWTKVKVRELNDSMFVLEHFLPAYKIFKPQ